MFFCLQINDYHPKNKKLVEIHLLQSCAPCPWIIATIYATCCRADHPDFCIENPIANPYVDSWICLGNPIISYALQSYSSVLVPSPL